LVWRPTFKKEGKCAIKISCANVAKTGSMFKAIGNSYQHSNAELHNTHK